jgi:hypothetical protein
VNTVCKVLGSQIQNFSPVARRSLEGIKSISKVRCRFLTVKIVIWTCSMEGILGQ